MTKIKVCGITNYEDAINAANLGAEYLGLNFYRQSPRYIQNDKAKEIITKLPKNMKKVGIFVNEKINNVVKVSNFCDLDLIQLSGDENPDFISGLKNILNKKIIKAFRVKNKSDVEKAKCYQTDFIMLDSFKKGLYGGTGINFNLMLAKNIDKKRLFLSGGLNIFNVRKAIEEIKPYAVDVCSSIESCPGKKDFKKMKKFIEAAK